MSEREGGVGSGHDLVSCIIRVLKGMETKASLCPSDPLVMIRFYPY